MSGSTVTAIRCRSILSRRLTSFILGIFSILADIHHSKAPFKHFHPKQHPASAVGVRYSPPMPPAAGVSLHRSNQPSPPFCGAPAGLPSKFQCKDSLDREQRRSRPLPAAFSVAARTAGSFQQAGSSCGRTPAIRDSSFVFWHLSEFLSRG